MLIAAACDKNSIDATVSEKYSDSDYVLVVETDTDEIVKVYATKEVNTFVLAEDFDAMFVECTVSGPMEMEEFEPIAAMQITRYNGSGLKLLEAVHFAEADELPIITDFIGGKGCDDRDASERTCTGECEASHDIK